MRRFQIAVDIPIGKLQYSGVAGGLYMASEKGKIITSNQVKLGILKRRPTALGDLLSFIPQNFCLSIEMTPSDGQKTGLRTLEGLP